MIDRCLFKKNNSTEQGGAIYINIPDYLKNSILKI